MRIGFWLPDLVAPSGGVSYAYRCAGYLRAAGHDVVLVHERAGFRYRWEPANATPVNSVRAFRRSDADVLVVPEIFAGSDDLDAPTTIVLNQNPFLTGGEESDARYRSALGVVVTSACTASYLEQRYPGVRLERAVVGVDTSVFAAAAAPSGRGRVVAWMPRKRPADAALVLAAAALGGWTDHPIDGLPGAEVAAALAGAGVFLAMGEREGLGLPVAEAMACGTPCVGFTGIGGAELLTEDTGWPVPDGDVTAAARVLGEVCALVDAGDPEIARRTSAAARLVATSYTRSTERQSALAAFGALLGS